MEWARRSTAQFAVLALGLLSANVFAAPNPRPQLTLPASPPANPYENITHTVQYTTTVSAAQNKPTDRWVTVAVVTVVMPGEAWQFDDGEPAVGVIISSLTVMGPGLPNGPGATTSTWVESRQVTWTMSGVAKLMSDWSATRNLPPATTTKAPPPPSLGTAVLSSAWSMTSSTAYHWALNWANPARRVWAEGTLTTIVSQVETVDAGYPATITRTGYTTEFSTASSSIENSPIATASGTKSWTRVTTWALATPTPRAS